MSTPVETIYSELANLVRHPTPELEQFVLPKISTWTQYFIIANQRDESDVMTYIIKRDPYISTLELQKAGCFPLHRLASKTMTETDKACLATLLDSRYFRLSDLNSDHILAIALAIEGHNSLFLRVLRRKSLQELALEQLRARHDGSLLAFQDHAVWLLGQTGFVPNDRERTTFLKNLDDQSFPLKNRKKVMNTCVEHLGFDRVLEKLATQDGITQKDYFEIQETFQTSMADAINFYLKTPIAKWLWGNSDEMSESDWKAIEVYLLKVPPRLKVLQQHGLMTYPVFRFQSNWAQYCAPQFINKIRSDPNVLVDLRKGYLARVLQDANESSVFRSGLFKSEFFAFLSQRQLNPFEPTIFPTQWPRLAFKIMMNRTQVIAESDITAFDNFPLTDLDEETLSLYFQVYISRYGFQRFLSEPRFNRKHYTDQAIVWHVIRRMIQSDGLHKLIIDDILKGKNKFLFKVIMKLEPEACIAALPQVLEAIDVETLSLPQVRHLIGPLIKAMNERLEDEDPSELMTLKMFFIKLLGKDALKQCGIDPHTTAPEFQPFRPGM